MICAAESTDRSPSGTRKTKRGTHGTLPGYPPCFFQTSRPWRLIEGAGGRAMCGNTKERCMPTSRSSSPIFWHGGCVVDFPTTPINLAQIRLIQMQLSSQIIEESCDSYPDLLLHARIPVLARPHARGASCGELQLEACRGSRSSSSNSSPVGSERSCRVSAVYMHREPSARAASHVGSVPV